MAKLISQQILIPKKVYIGDTAELRCTFNTNSENLKSITQNGEVQLSTEHFQNLPDKNDYDIKSINLSSTGVDYYQMVITFVPWKTGTLKIPDMKLEDVVLEIQPISIVSLTEQNKTTALKDSAAPLLLPGTSYKLYGSLVGLLIFLLILIQLFLKRKKLAFFLKNKKLSRKYRKNKRTTIKELKKLLNDKSSDGNIASKIQQIMRHYLEVRLEYPFTRAATSELMNCFYNATSHLLSEKKEEAFNEIAASFIRTDFIRYSSGAAFNQNEKKDLIIKLIEKIEIMEETEIA